ncbi:transcriptional regulatory protein ZraR [bacterium BMS3Abin04]|nr:transcriptional regulatory protein ZraR [bacterium BMS3Abin04]
MEKGKIKILIVEDEDYDVKRIIKTLEPFKNTIEVKDIISSGRDALLLIKEDSDSYDVIILDYQISGGLYGVELISAIKKISPSLQIIIITKMTLNQTDLAFAAKLIRSGASWFGTKNPIDIEDFIYQPTDFLLAIQNAYEKRQLQLEKSWLINERDATISKLEQRVQDILIERKIVGKSSKTEQIKFFISKYADVNANILITGESGTGKELVATHLHYLSKKRLENFVTVNCSAIPDTLFESEFFGYSKGAFTGAREEKIGFFEQADKGTLFLDEVGDLSANAQGKLLRALESGEIDKIGRKKKYKVDVRIISATNKDLAQLVKQKSFRQDLYYRLNILNISIPALRERKEDIKPLIVYFLKIYSAEYNIRVPEISKEVMNFLTDLEWYGNTRELKNLVLRMMLLHNGEINMDIVRLCLKDQLKRKFDEFENTKISGKEFILPLRKAERNFRLKYIDAVRQLFSTDAEAAKYLGVAKSNFHRILKDLNFK